MKTFLTRSITAIVFAAIVIGGMIWNIFSFYILFFIIASLGLLEYFKLVKGIHSGYQRAPGYQKIMAFLLLPTGFLIASGKHFFIFGQSAIFFGMQLLAFLVMLMFVITSLAKDSLLAFKNLGYSLLGVLYLGLPFSLMIALRWHAPIDGIALIPFGILFSLWINDSLAYITGSLIGKHPFAPKISPKKTWEGTLGGIVLTLIAAAIWGSQSSSYTMGTWMAVAGITAITGTLGDLLESVLKRKAGVKDSGKLLPGHGGILDRFDSMILAIPFVWLLMLLF